MWESGPYVASPRAQKKWGSKVVNQVVQEHISATFRKSTELQFIAAKEAMVEIKTLLAKRNAKHAKSRELTKVVNLRKNMEQRA